MRLSPSRFGLSGHVGLVERRWLSGPRPVEKRRQGKRGGRRRWRVSWRRNKDRSRLRQRYSYLPATTTTPKTNIANPPTRDTSAPLRPNFSTRMNTVSAATQARFMIPTAKRTTIRAQQQPRQRSPCHPARAHFRLNSARPVPHQDGPSWTFRLTWEECRLCNQRECPTP